MVHMIGVYNYPVDLAAAAMLTTIIDAIPQLESLRCIRIVLYDKPTCDRFVKAFESMTGMEVDAAN